MGTKIRVEVDSDTLKALVASHLRSMMGVNFDPTNIIIEVQSKQNYRVHEWERGEFRAIYETK